MRQKSTSWSKVSGWYNKKVGVRGHFYHEKAILSKVLDIISEAQAASVLDLGCGQGILERTISGEIRYTGIDISPELVNQAKKLSKKNNARFMFADVSKPLPLSEDEKFDVGVCMLALQNIENFEGVFRNFDKHIGKEGTVVLVLNHPYFRIPRASGWDILENGKQVRWISNYLLERKIPIVMNPGEKRRQLQKVTWSFHVPLSKYVQLLVKHGFVITGIDEVSSPKESVGRHADRENAAREEIPLFMIVIAKKVN